MTGLSDSFNRPINYMRISVTDRCNLRCIYCMPEEGICLNDQKDMLSYEEIFTLARAAAATGITKVRITGGEPLVRLGIVSLVEMLSKINEIDDLSLTTNGLLLRRYATGLKNAGLKRVNVSLDTLRENKFKTITRGQGLEDVLKGIEAAKEAGLLPVKINVVVLRGINDDEILDFARKTLTSDWNVRFIEFMPFGSQQMDENRLVTVTEIRERLATFGPLIPVTGTQGGGPAKYYRFSGGKGSIGFISPVTEHFCFSCNRLRLTSTGMLRPCLLDEYEINLRDPLRRGVGLDELSGLIRDGAQCKPEGHRLAENIVPRDKFMTQVGG
ncbi:MAG: GTP 3',8-cyclase MoaA [Dehalococcoidia bacterium]|nr:GTP 3',8-cyclase MoaA [Dehalococcoidia bacterium]MDZ4246904.1 GTP 3',8-cyclase MoaA [Dehalococcoidia bacterium]